MKYRPEIYAKALVAAWKSASGSREDCCGRFLGIVSESGDMKNMGKILDALEALLTKDRGGNVVSVESALGLSEGAAKKISEKLSARSGSKNDLIKFSKNSALIAGVRITINGSRELDFSFKRKLNKLFK